MLDSSEKTACNGRMVEKACWKRCPNGVSSMMSYRHPALRQLAEQQVRFAPPPRRLEQLRRTERLLAEVSEGKPYPYQYVCYRVTDFRPDTYPDLVISGEDLKHDLGLLIAQLADSLPA